MQYTVNSSAIKLDNLKCAVLPTAGYGQQKKNNKKFCICGQQSQTMKSQLFNVKQTCQAICSPHSFRSAEYDWRAESIFIQQQHSVFLLLSRAFWFFFTTGTQGFYMKWQCWRRSVWKSANTLLTGKCEHFSFEVLWEGDSDPQAACTAACDSPGLCFRQ